MHPAGFLSMLIIVTLLKENYADPCSTHTIKNQYKRSANYTIQSNDIAISDNFLSKGWYRFNSGAGNDMVTWAPSIYQCCTIYPMWMNGTLPNESDGEVNRTVCIVGLYESCLRTLTIKVKACRGYRVYYLEPAPQTSTGYCIGEELPCPAGQSSLSGFTPCENMTPVNTNPFVNVSLENKPSYSTRFRPAEPVFKCLFDEPDGSPYWYDTHWYINTDLAKVVESQLYMSNQSWLYPKDWVNKYDLNMVVKCSIRVRHLRNSTPGHHNYSKDFKAGMFPSSFSYRVKEGDTISIKFTITVPVGCLDLNRQSLCKASIYILTPEYQSSTSSCQNFSNQGEISFEENRCGVIIESSTWWKQKILNVTGKTDGVINKRDREVYIRLGSFTESAEDSSGVWYNFTMPDIKILLDDSDTKIANKLCFASTDPRMKTFDGQYWTAQLAGEFVLYRDKQRRIAVHALFSSCVWSGWRGEGPCGCGVAVRVENSLFVYRTCEEISYRYSKPLLQHEVVYHICDNRHMVVDIGDPWTKIVLSNGAVVQYRIGRDWLYHIYVTPSIFDEDNVEGLCGNPNGRTDDFILQGSSFPTSIMWFFQASWSVNINSKESLFGVNRLQDIGNFQLQKYCDCATEIHSSENSIANHFAANCSIATPAILCSQQTTTQKYTSTCKSYQDRFKRDVNLEDDDSDDVMEVFPLKLDPSFDPNFIPPIPTWKNNWTESAAREICENMMLNDPAQIECQKYIPMDNSTKIAIEDCILDIRDSGTTEFSSFTRESMDHQCFEQIKKYEVFHESKDFQGVSVVQKIGQLVCPNNCSANGNCNEGICICNGSYVGTDCSLDKSTPPANLTLPEQGLCKTSKRACAKTNIFGYFVSQTVFAKLEEFKITDSGELKTLSTNVIEANYINPTMLRIIFPTSYRKRRSASKNVYGFYISLSYDEINYSDSLTLVIYNDLCYSCSASTMECNRTSTCNQYPGIAQNPKNSGKNDIFLPLIISLSVVCVLIIGTITVLILMKRRHTGHFSPWCVDTKKPRHLHKHPPVQRYDTINLDLRKFTSQNYETLKPPVVGRSNAAFDG